MIKVLYLSYDGMTDPLGQSQVIPYLKGLSKSGYQFTIISFEKKSRFKKSGNQIRDLLNESGIEWLPKIFSSRPPFLSKLYDGWQMRRSAMLLHKQERFSFVHCRSYVAAETGLAMSKRFGLPFLFDMRGFWVDERVDSGQWRLDNPLFKYLYRLYKKKEKKYLQSAIHIISLTWTGKDELVQKYNVPEEKISVIPCCADLKHFDYAKISGETVISEKKKLGIKEDDTIISYLGSLGGWYMLNEMLDFFSAMNERIPKLKFLFITHDNADAIKQTAEKHGISRGDIIVQPASRNEVPSLLALSNWGIFFIKDAYSKKASSPTKQAEIMSMGIPVICNDVGDTGRIITTSKTGLVVSSFTQKEYCRVIDDANTIRQIDKAQIRQAAIQYFDLDKGIFDYSEVYKRILSGSCN